jgi:hypothetical protein
MKECSNFMAIRSILPQFGIFYGHFVYFASGHLVYFPRFGMLYQNIWQL